MDFPLRCLFVIAIGLCLPGVAGFASPEKEARVTQVIKDVQLLTTDGAAHPASVDDSVRPGMTVRTGVESRLELTFTDQTIARLGPSTAFGLKDGPRKLNLEDGAMLVQAPRSAKGAQIRTASLAAAIAGTTIVFESQPKIFKFLVLEGTSRLYRPGHLGDSVLVGPGQMVFGNPNAALSNPVDFDIGHFLKTCRFITDFPPLHSETLMASESQRQQREKSKKSLIDTNLVIFGGGSVVSLVNPAQMGSLDQVTGAAATAPMPSATPASSDLGSIETLASSRPAPSPTPTPSAVACEKQ